jgi:hemoglobin
MSSLYERLGGEAAIEAAVARFYDKVMDDAALAPFFKGLDMDAQTKKMIAFMMLAFGGPKEYHGRDLRTAHRRLVRAGLDATHFDKVAAHLRATLNELHVEQAIVDEVLAIVASTRSEVLDS